jgi:hypothetical protein
MLRTLLISLLIAVWLVILASKKRNSNQLTLYSIVSVLAAVIVLWYAKHNSSLGRLHIWKLSWQMLAKQSMWHGIGAGHFNVQYNHAQAAYFAQHSLYTKEAMLADDGYYAFNEFIHVGIEYGWWAGVLLLCFFAWFIWQNWLVVKRKEGFSFPLVYILLLWPVAISCWVGYPLHKPWLAIMAALLIGLLAISRMAVLRHWKNTLVIMLVVASALYSGFKVRHFFEARQILTATKEAWQVGEKRTAIAQLQKYCNAHVTAIPHHEVLATWYWLVSEEEKAIACLEKHHLFHCNQRIHETLGKWYASQKRFEVAAQHFFTALYITPHKLQSRALLSNLYAVWGKPTLARKWAYEVAQYPAKFSTNIADALKHSANMYLANNSTNTSFIFNQPACQW